MNKITKAEILEFIIEKGKTLELTDVIDVVIEANAIIGVGLISLGDSLQKYCYDKAKENNHHE